MGGEFDIGGDAEEERSLPGVADAPGIVSEGKPGEEEFVAHPTEGFNGIWFPHVQPTIVSGKFFGDGVEDSSGGYVAEIGHPLGKRGDDLRTANATETRGDGFFVEENSMDGDGVERALETVAGIARERGTDPDGIIIDHGRFLSGAPHVPNTGGRLSVDPAPNGIGFTKAIRNGDVVPACFGVEATVGSPTVPVFGACAGLGREEEAEFRDAVRCDDPERPVLIVAGEVGVSGSSLADDIGGAAIAGLILIDPSFEGDGITIGEIEGTSRSTISGFESGPFAIEFRGGVIGSEVGEFGRTGASLIAFDSTDGLERGCFFRAEFPEGGEGGVIGCGSYAQCEAEDKCGQQAGESRAIRCPIHFTICTKGKKLG